MWAETDPGLAPAANNYMGFKVQMSQLSEPQFFITVKSPWQILVRISEMNACE